MPRVSPEQRAHRNWLALIRPTGLVVAAPALARAAGGLEARDVEGQHRLRAWREEFANGAEPSPQAAFRAFAESVLDWNFAPNWYCDATRDGSPAPTAALPEYGETLTADFAVREPDAPEDIPPEDGPRPWQLAVNT